VRFSTRARASTDASDARARDARRDLLDERYPRRARESTPRRARESDADRTRAKMRARRRTR